MVEKIFAIITLLPLYGILIWTYLHPNPESDRYKKETKLSEGTIKFIAGIGIFILTISVSFMFENYFIRIILILSFLVYIAYGLFKLRQEILK